ncbi:unnamed protein product [Clavelina lepadiformis]|uniref:Vomeronasal type-1 receptor n=1 Tax=Clavelina lepadiformis TaxID=159417 RepID=A0ABP0FHR0_CLALP
MFTTKPSALVETTTVSLENKTERSFYVKKQTRHLTTPITRFLSSFSFVWLCLNELGNPVLLLTLVKYEKYQGKLPCVAVKGKDIEGGILYSLSGSVIALNLLIAALLAHPILKSRASALTLANKDNGSSSDGKVLAVIKRSFVIAILIIVIDTFSLTTPLITRNNLVHVTTHAAYSVALLLLTLFGFKDWKSRLAPWCLSFSTPEIPPRPERIQAIRLQKTVNTKSDFHGV